MTKKHQNKITENIDKFEEPATIFKKELSNNIEITDHPDFEKLVSKCVQDSKDGKLISHEEVRRIVREKFPFLK